MGFWSSLLKTGGKAISYGGKATVATGKSVGNAVLLELEEKITLIVVCK